MNHPAALTAVSRALADVLVDIDAYWLERYPDGPDAAFGSPQCPIEVSVMWAEARRALAQAGVLRVDEMPRDDYGDIDMELMARNRAATEAARHAHELRETLIDIARTGVL